MDELKRLYEDYLKNVQTAAAEMRPGDGLFGFGRKLSDDPCHDAFIATMEQYLDRISVDAVPEKVYEVLSFIYKAPITYQNVDISVFGMMQAIHGLTLPLIPCLSSQDASILKSWYESVYSNGERLPVQNQVLNALKAHNRGEDRKRRVFSFFNKAI